MRPTILASRFVTTAWLMVRPPGASLTSHIGGACQRFVKEQGRPYECSLRVRVLQWLCVARLLPDFPDHGRPEGICVALMGRSPLPQCG